MTSQSPRCEACGPPAGPQLTLGLLRRLTFREARFSLARERAELGEPASVSARLRQVMRVMLKGTRDTMRQHRIIEFWKDEVRQTNREREQEDPAESVDPASHRGAFRAMIDLCAELRASRSVSSEDQKMREGLENIVSLCHSVGRALRSMCDRHTSRLHDLNDLSNDIDRLTLRARTVLGRFKAEVKSFVTLVQSTSEAQVARVPTIRSHDSGLMSRGLTPRRRTPRTQSSQGLPPPFFEKVQSMSNKFEDMIEHVNGLEEKLVKDSLNFVRKETGQSPVQQSTVSRPLRILQKAARDVARTSVAVCHDARQLPSSYPAASHMPSLPSLPEATIDLAAHGAIGTPFANTCKGSVSTRGCSSLDLSKDPQGSNEASVVGVTADQDSGRNSPAEYPKPIEKEEKGCHQQGSRLARPSMSRCTSVKSIPSPSSCSQFSGPERPGSASAARGPSTPTSDDIEELIINDDDDASRVFETAVQAAIRGRAIVQHSIVEVQSQQQRVTRWRLSSAQPGDRAKLSEQVVSALPEPPLCVAKLERNPVQGPSSNIPGLSRPPSVPRPQSAARPRSAAAPFCPRSVVSTRPSSARSSSQPPVENPRMKRQESIYELVGHATGVKHPTVSLSPRKACSPREQPAKRQPSPRRVLPRPPAASAVGKGSPWSAAAQQALQGEKQRGAINLSEGYQQQDSNVRLRAERHRLAYPGSRGGA